VFGTGQKERLVPFSPELRRRIFRYQQLKSRKGVGGEWLFTGFEGSRWEKRNSMRCVAFVDAKMSVKEFR
jgi:site-specific recombinase XerC